MNSHADKTQENKRKSIGNGITQKQSKGESTYLLEDNRSEAIAQRKLHEMANDSTQVKQLSAFQKMVNHNSIQHYQTVQKKENRTTSPENSKNDFSKTIENHSTIIKAELPSRAIETGFEIIQMKKIIAEEKDLAGLDVQLHYHITYESTKLSGLHVTFTNKRQKGARTWQMVYKYNHNKKEWTGPHYTNEDRPTKSETELANSHLAQLQNKAVEIWQKVHAEKLRAKESEAQRASLLSGDKDVAFPILGGGKIAGSVGAVSGPSNMSANTPAPSGRLPFIWDEDYGLTPSLEKESDDMDYLAE